MNGLKQTIQIVKNKYTIAFGVFLVCILFLDRNDVFNQLQRRQELKKLEEKKKYYQQEIDKTQTDLNSLQNNPQALEKFAREKFYLKKSNEDVFIVEPVPDTPAKNK